MNFISVIIIIIIIFGFVTIPVILNLVLYHTIKRMKTEMFFDYHKESIMAECKLLAYCPFVNIIAFIVYAIIILSYTLFSFSVIKKILNLHKKLKDFLFNEN